MLRPTTALFLILCVLLLVTPAFAVETTADVAEDDLVSVAAGNNAFALDIYAQLAERKGNLFFSPFSLSTAMAMTFAGAAGETASQMADVLHFSLPPEGLHPVLAELMKRITSAGNGSVKMANALWGQAGYPFREDFLELVERYYGAGLREVEFVDDELREQTRETINRWVEERTDDKIRDLLKQNDLTSLTRLVLTNAIYFKGAWEKPFLPKDTKPMPFYLAGGDEVSVSMMYQKGRFAYGEHGQVQILEMPYTDGHLSMVILLPGPGMELAKLEQGLTSGELDEYLSQTRVQQVEVFLPRFRTEARFEVSKELKDLGMVDAFDDLVADFSSMSPDPRLHISKVIHQGLVEVNEAGTEAAAATAVVMGTKSIQLTKPPVFLADHPFVFLIRDTRYDTVLFLGRLMDPSE